MTDTDTTRTIRQAGPEDTDRLCELLAESFQDDQLTVWMVPDPVERAAALPGMFRVFVEVSLAHGGILIGGDCTAALLYLSPEGLVAAAEDDEETGRRLVEAIGADGAGALTAILEAQAANHPADEPHYYGAFAGVRPGQQHGGWMTGMLSELVARADAEGVGVYAEASSRGGEAVCLRTGFTPRGEELRLPDGRTLRPMWHEARRSGT